MLRIFKPQFFSHLVNSLTTQNKVLGTHHHEAAYIVLRTLAQSIPNDVTKIARRKAQLTGTVFHTGQSVLLLTPMRIIIGEHLLETTEDVTIPCYHLLVLANVETIAVVEYKQDVVFDDVIVPESLRLCIQFPTQVFHELIEHVLFLRRQNESLVGMIGKELIAVEFTLDGRSLYKLSVEQQNPTMVLSPCAVILFASYLSRRESQQRPIALVIRTDAVFQALRKLLL